MMPFFAPLNASNSYLVKELNMYNINNKKIEDAFKDIFSFTDFLKLLLKK